ncbi:MAG: hypothetical protein KVP17_004951 [Porospora cf. gigantea B]|uniref:uncharacterized protein n=2 Tax=Porospora cf. gigantea B TaxID=2853592 RepID=UPI003571C4B3|nr:MAG: hypothetical protein KVP17_004951 [Porospora cf. gigantea B]
MTRLPLVTVSKEAEGGDLSKLTTLDVQGRNLTEIDDLDSCANLRSLNASRNQLETMDWCCMNLNLVELIISENNMRHVSARIGNLANLQTLNLSDNELRSLPSLAGMDSLRTLILRNNKISELPPLGYLPSLRTVILSENRLRSFPRFEAPALRKISLTSNRLTTFPFGVEFAHVVELRLHKNRIQNIPQEVCSMASLSLIDLGHNPLVDESSLTHLGSVRALSNLNLRDTPLLEKLGDGAAEFVLTRCPRVSIFNNQRIAEPERKRPLQKSRIPRQKKFKR